MLCPLSLSYRSPGDLLSSFLVEKREVGFSANFFIWIEDTKPSFLETHGKVGIGRHEKKINRIDRKGRQFLR